MARRRSTRRCSRPACRSSASATASRRWPWRSAARSPRPACASTAAPRPPCRPTARTLFDGQPTDAVGLDEPRRRRAPGARRVPGHRRVGRLARSRRSRTTSARLYGVQWHPEVVHSAYGQRVLENFLPRGARIAPNWTTARRRRRPGRRDPRPGRRRAGHLRAVRRCRLRGRGGARAPGRRRPADLRLRRPRPAAGGRGRAGREGLRRRDRRRPRRRRRQPTSSWARSPASPTRRPSARPSAASSSGPSRARRARSSRPATAGRASSWCRARSTRTSSSPAAARAPRTSSRTTTSAACPTTCSSSWSSRCARCSRTRCARSASSSACPRRSSGGSRSRGRVSASASSARSRASGWRSCAPPISIAREELTAAGLDRDIWQCPVVLLADVRSVGVQGDGRTYGHPIVLRPVSSEDAMTADWTRAAVRRAGADLDPDHQRGARGQPGRPRRDEQAAGHHRVGVAQLGEPGSRGVGRDL